MRKLLLAAGLAATGFYFYNKNQTNVPRVREVFLASDQLKNDLRITQISDFHNHKNMNPKEIRKKVEEYDPHFIAFTGDLISENTTDFIHAIALVKTLVDTGIPCYYVYGNHEFHNPNRREFFQTLQALGVKQLNNETVYLEEHDLYLTGLTWAVSTEQYKETVQKQHSYHVVLCHSPSDILPTGGQNADLILCGHTHGGQVRLPGIGAIVIPTQGFFGAYDKGLFQLGDAILYIDSGLGNTRLDLRAFNPIQFSNVTINVHR